jgi:hypothetical protein
MFTAQRPKNKDMYESQQQGAFHTHQFSRGLCDSIILSSLFLGLTSAFGPCSSACFNKPLKGFVTLSRAVQGQNKIAFLLDPETNQTFSFISFNTPNLLRLEVGGNIHDYV